MSWLQWRRNTPSKQSFGGASHWSQTMPAPLPQTFVSAERSGATAWMYYFHDFNPDPAQRTIIVTNRGWTSRKNYTLFVFNKVIMTQF